MSTATAPPPNFSRPLSATTPHPSIPPTTPSHSLRSASSSAPAPPPLPVASSSSSTNYFTPTDSIVPSAPPSSPHVSKARASKAAGTTGLGIGKPVARGGGFGAPGTGTAARGPSRKRSRVDLAGEARDVKEEKEMSSGGAGKLVPQDEKAGFDNAIEFDPDHDGEDDDDDDEGGGKKSRSVSGAANARRKIQISYIEDKARRHITFSKRKAGIMKKAFELSTLTGTQVLLLVVSETGLVYTFTTSKLQPLVTREEGKNLIQACLNAPNGEGPDGGPSGDGGMTTGARAVKGGIPGAPIRHKDDSSPYDTIPMPPIPMPDSPESEDPQTPTSSSTNTSRRPSAALPRRGRAVSTAVPKSKKAQTQAQLALEAANNNEFELEDEDQEGALSEMARSVLEAQKEAQKREALRLRGMDFLVGDEDDQEMGLNGLGGMGMGGGGGARSMSGIAPTHLTNNNNPPVSSLYQNDIRSPTLGGLQQYDDYSAQDLVLPSKLDEQDDDSMQHYLSTSSAASPIPPLPSTSSLQQTSSSASSSSSGLPGHQQQHHLNHQQHLSPHLHHQPSPPPSTVYHQHQQLQHTSNQQMNYGQYSTHMHRQQQQLHNGGGGGFSPGHHQALSPSGTTGYDGYGGQAGGSGGGGAFGSQSGAGW